MGETTILTGPDELRSHMWHDETGVVIDGDHIQLTAKPRRKFDRPAAVASVRLDGYSYGHYSLKYRLPGGLGCWPGIWLFSGPLEVDPLEGRQVGLCNRWRTFSTIHTYNDDRSAKGSTGPIPYNTKRGWNSLEFLVGHTGLEMPSFFLPYPKDYRLPDWFHLYFTNWVWPDKANSFRGGTFEIKDFEYSPI